MILRLNKPKKLLFIGGHHNSAVATIDWLASNNGNTLLDFYWIGKKYVSANNYSPEYSEVSSRGIPFYDITAGKLFRTSSILYLPVVIYNLALIPVGFIQAFYYLLKIRPKLIISFGGYISVPIVVAGTILNIRSILHEQTSVIGLANKIAGLFASGIYTSWPEKFYENEPKIYRNKIVHTGLPISEDKINLKEENAYKFDFPVSKPTLYLTGGKSGSLFLNKIFLEVIDILTKNYNLIWSCGRRIGAADYSEINSTLGELSEPQQKSVILKDYFNELEVHKALNTADIVIARGGGHTIYELALVKKPALVVPIPWSSNQEQLKNARILESFGLAVILAQEELTPYKLLEAIENFVDRIDTIKQDTKSSEFVPSNGQANLGNEILQSIKK